MANDVRLTAAQKKAVDQVLGLLKGIRDRAPERPSVYGRTIVELHTDVDLRQHWEGLAYQRERNVVSILGGRGVGKTTVLEEVLRRLLDKESADTIIIDPIVPESFLQGDHPLGWISAALWPHVRQIEEQLRRSNRDAGANELRKVYRDFASSVRAFVLGDRATSASPYDATTRLIDESTWLAVAGYEVPRKLGALVETLFALHLEVSPRGDRRSQGRPLLVVSFDDVDLHPDRLASILSAMPVVLAHPAVVVLVAADPELLNSGAEAQCRKLVPNEDASKARQLARDQLRKRLPLDLRVSLPTLTVPERLDFVPEGEESSLRDVLAGIRICDRFIGPKTMLDLFDLSWNLPQVSGTPEAATCYVHMLPDDPRSLSQLYWMTSRYHRALETVPREGGPLRGNPEYRRQFFGFMRAFLLAVADEYVEAGSLFEQTYEFLEGEAEVRIRLGDFSLGRQATERPLFKGGDRALVPLEPFLQVDGATLPPPVSGLLFLVTELAYMPLRTGIFGALQYPGGIGPNDGGILTREGRFGWPWPQFESFLIHDALARRWRLPLIRSARELAGVERLAGETATLWRLRLLYWYLSSVVEAARSPGEEIRYEIADADLSSDDLWADLVKHASTVLLDISDSAGTDSNFPLPMQNDYERWVLRDLAWMSFDEVARDEEVKARIAAFRAQLCEDLEITEDQMEAGLSDAEGYLAQAKENYPEYLRLDALDLQSLVLRIAQGDDQALAQAMLILRIDRTRSDKRAQLEAVLRRLGHEVPGLTEAWDRAKIDQTPAILNE